jgi:hypothetical protein
MGKPIGSGGPWKDTTVKAGVPSDPYLIGFYDQRKLKLSHNMKDPVSFSLEADPTGNGNWMLYKKLSVASGETFEYTFPDSFQSRWIRFSSNKNCSATAWLLYN